MKSWKDALRTTASACLSIFELLVRTALFFSAVVFGAGMGYAHFVNEAEMIVAGLITGNGEKVMIHAFYIAAFTSAAAAILLDWLVRLAFRYIPSFIYRSLCLTKRIFVSAVAHFI